MEKRPTNVDRTRKATTTWLFRLVRTRESTIAPDVEEAPIIDKNFSTSYQRRTVVTKMIVLLLANSLGGLVDLGHRFLFCSILCTTTKNLSLLGW